MLKRRDLLKAGTAAMCASALPTTYALSESVAARQPITRRIAMTKEKIPAIGMGSWRTFDVGNDGHALQERTKVLQRFFELGGQLIDSSPMFGSSQEVLGRCLGSLTERNLNVFRASKVWTPAGWIGVRQMIKSIELWGDGGFDLMQIHNLMSWKSHIETLKEWKEEGKIRYIGVTTSQGRRHDDVEDIMRTQPIDFVQLSYNIVNREAENRLLPLALERGISVIANRPFQRSVLFDRVKTTKLPIWAQDFECYNWAQFFLKFIISHRAVTAAVPATSRVDHMTENMGALYGRLPDPKTRRRMHEFYEKL